MTPRPEPAVGAIVVEDGALLLVRRARPPGAGLWSVPGGRVEAGERLQAAVVREVREETGIAVRVDDLAGFAERIGADHHFVILDFFAQAVPTGQTPRAGDDAREAAWVPLADVADLDLVDGLLDFLRRVGSVAP
ncbi:MAG TPA: NUDIX domain-containing protein [Acidimicrobiia bacterium]|nr:NUDIX domain-containing protein [Acidimicrobiia bacterium]